MNLKRDFNIIFTIVLIVIISFSISAIFEINFIRCLIMGIICGFSCYDSGLYLGVSIGENNTIIYFNENLDRIINESLSKKNVDQIMTRWCKERN